MKINHLDCCEEKENISSKILNALPDWFGLPDCTNNYIQECKKLPFWSAEVDNDTVGFIALQETSKYTVEIFVMGVLLDYHHLGIGTKLYETCEAYAIQKGYDFIQVKTVKEGTYKEYDQSNAFYKKMGFKELECFPTLWDKTNPCQIFIKSLK